jgi:hypothetical protein
MHDTRIVTDAEDLPAHSCNAQDSIPPRKVNCTGVFLKYIPWNPMVPRGELAQEQFPWPVKLRHLDVPGTFASAGFSPSLSHLSPRQTQASAITSAVPPSHVTFAALTQRVAPFSICCSQNLFS